MIAVASLGFSALSAAQNNDWRGNRDDHPGFSGATHLWQTRFGTLLDKTYVPAVWKSRMDDLLYGLMTPTTVRNKLKN